MLDAVLKSACQAFTHARKLEAVLFGHLEQLRPLEANPSLAARAAAVRTGFTEQFQGDVGVYLALAGTVLELLQALLLRRDAPELEVEAARVKAAIERVGLHQEATSMQASRREELRVRCPACCHTSRFALCVS